MEGLLSTGPTPSSFIRLLFFGPFGIKQKNLWNKQYCKWFASKFPENYIHGPVLGSGYCGVDEAIRIMILVIDLRHSQK